MSDERNDDEQLQHTGLLIVAFALFIACIGLIAAWALTWGRS